jgi:mannosyltransferase OCH1-like enzyme
MTIPKKIYICHKSISDKFKEHSKNWIDLNPDYELKLYDNELCEKFLLEEFSELHCNIFKFIKDGPIKSDFWRCCVLYKYGGVYADADILPTLPLKDVIVDDADFATCLSYYKGFNLHFIMANAGEPLLNVLINKYIDYFTNNIPYDYWPWSICRILDVVSNENQIVLNNEQHNKEGIYIIDNKKYQLLQDVFGRNYYENISVYNNKTLLWARTNVWNSDGHDFW